MNREKIRFYLPDFYHKQQTNLLLHRLLQEYPEYFYDDIEIGACYGCFPGSLWNGGRIEHGFCYQSDVRATLEMMNEQGIPCRFTFTNPMIEEKHLSDTFCNMCMELGDNGMNEVLVNSPILETYIRENYPSYAILSSTTKCLTTEEQLQKELQKDYKLIVLDVSYNNSDKIWNLPDKHRFEILVDSFCRDCCPDRRRHYEEVGRAQIEFDRMQFDSCKFVSRDFYQIKEQNKMFITNENLYGRYIEAGFRHFKLDGRAFNRYKVIESYVYYMVKTQYRDMIREALLRAADKFKE